MDVVNIEIDKLIPNDYNPNVMTELEFDELCKEIEHLKKIPKPIVVRKVKSKYIIVDGEQNYKGACAVGLKIVPCEIITANNFEAMRQTYKRNQHGRHNPVKEGEMFSRMMKDKAISIRGLADEINISDGKIRYALMYMRVKEKFPHCAFPFGIEQLSVDQIRWADRLPIKLAEQWLYGGAKMAVVMKLFTGSYWIDNRLNDFLKEIEEEGLLDFVRFNNTHSVEKALKLIKEWGDFEYRWARGGITREQLRPYLKHYYSKQWVLRDESLMRGALRLLIDSKTATFRLSPDEFSETIDNPPIGSVNNNIEFMKRVKAAIYEKTGEVVKADYETQETLTKMELEEAPEYIRNSELDTWLKYALWKIDKPDHLKKDFIEGGNIRYENGKAREAVAYKISRMEWDYELKHRFDNMDKRIISRNVVSTIQLYDEKTQKSEMDKMENLLMHSNSAYIELAISID